MLVVNVLCNTHSSVDVDIDSDLFSEIWADNSYSAEAHGLQQGQAQGSMDLQE